MEQAIFTRRSRLPFSFVTMLMLAATGCGGRSPAPRLPEIRPAESLVDTDVLPHTAGPITPGRNYVFCATFQLAWDELRYGVFKEPVALSGAPPMVDILNANTRPALKLDATSYLARAGLADSGIVEQIRAEAKRKFPQAGIRIPDADRGSVVAYAFLEKSLPFAESFDRLAEPLSFAHEGGPTKVHAFGFRGDLLAGAPRTSRLLNQVKVRSYISDDDFVLQLTPKQPGDTIVMAKVPPAETLAATIATVKTRAAPDDFLTQHVGSNETLLIPVISVGVMRRYHELEDQDVENAPWKAQGYYVKYADQDIRLRIDETGAALSSAARNEYAKSAPTEQNQPRRFVFDRPFLLWLERDSASDPYCALWIETPELLEKFVNEVSRN